ncbi:DUF4258 domain-containing protein [Algoriphagus kandeliae]|uniref:DUF4258 domain-containing protein n=1 Tax=Algoriphagus kandeliae TaxID=2562278 RepID=A0A4Y9QPC6_9BACT|nr:DUF4258 domain-containing protein [Algoriphagus kandeliae]TFV94481.1 DUF4258 domain-containing protein [Algoriphagus kandeliae]
METRKLISIPQPTLHGKTRMGQRGISEEVALLVIKEGEVIHKQGLKFFFVPKAKRADWQVKDAEAVANLMVITDQSIREIITCYKSDRAIHRVKKKSKRLKK